MSGFFNKKSNKFQFLLITLIFSLLITACGAKTPPAPQTLLIGNYQIETIVLNDAEIVSVDNVTCVQNNVEVNCINVDKNVTTLLKKDSSTESASIQIRVLSPELKPAVIRFVKPGGSTCPDWAAGLFTACSCLESTINYLR